MGKNVGFISFRISGTDGVSLETVKWSHIFERLGHKCFFMAGDTDLPKERSFIVPETHFQHPNIRELYNLAFNNSVRPSELTGGLHKYRELLKTKLYEFCRKFDLDLIVAVSDNLLYKESFHTKHLGVFPYPPLILVTLVPGGVGNNQGGLHIESGDQFYGVLDSLSLDHPGWLENEQLVIFNSHDLPDIFRILVHRFGAFLELHHIGDEGGCNSTPKGELVLSRGVDHDMLHPVQMGWIT